MRMILCEDYVTIVRRVNLTGIFIQTFRKRHHETVSAADLKSPGTYLNATIVRAIILHQEGMSQPELAITLLTYIRPRCP